MANDNKPHENIIQNGGKTKTPKKKKEKPGIQEFNSLVEDIITDEKKRDPVAAVLRVLKAGYKGGVGSRSMEGFFNLLFEWDHFWKLAVCLSFEEAKGNSKTPVSELISHLRSRARELSDYPITDLYNSGHQLTSTARESILLGWIKNSIESDNFNQDWGRQALICIMLMESESCRLETVRALVEHLPMVRKPRKSVKKSANYLKVNEVNYFKILSDIFRKDLSKQKTRMNQILDILTPSIELQKPMREEVRQLNNKMRDLSENNLKITNEASQIKSKLALAQKKIETMENQHKKTLEELAGEREKHTSLDKYWKDKHSQTLSGQSHEIKTFLLHEVSEAKIALSMNPPDTDIALSMVKRMEEYLKGG